MPSPVTSSQHKTVTLNSIADKANDNLDELNKVADAANKAISSQSQDDIDKLQDVISNSDLSTETRQQLSHDAGTMTDVLGKEGHATEWNSAVEDMQKLITSGAQDSTDFLDAKDNAKSADKIDSKLTDLLNANTDGDTDKALDKVKDLRNAIDKSNYSDDVKSQLKSSVQTLSNTLGKSGNADAFNEAVKSIQDTVQTSDELKEKYGKSDFSS